MPPPDNSGTLLGMPAMSNLSMQVRRGLFLLGVTMAATTGVVLWGRVIIELTHTELFMQDWFVYYAAGAASRARDFSLLFDGNAFTDFQYALLKPWFVAPPTLHPWLYPPLFLLLLAPLTILSFPVSYAVFQLSTGAAALVALAWRGAQRGFSWWSALLLLAFPASCPEVLAGQNAFLSTALLIGGVRALDSQPALAGAMLGALAYKPQLFLMVPIVLVAKRAWRAFGFLCASTLLLVLISAVVFGPLSWWLWLDSVVRGGDPSQANWYNQTFLTGFSFYVCATLAGMAPLAAKLAQAAVSLAAALAVWFSYRRTAPEDIKLGVLLMATAIATPHLQPYDMLLVGAAAILFFVRSREGIGVYEFLLLSIAWMLPLLRPALIPAGMYIVPVLLAALLIYGVKRSVDSSRRTRGFDEGVSAAPESYSPISQPV
jgi:alpha-1,2-mannosyltransferase